MSYYLTQGLHRALRHNPNGLATVCGARRHNFRVFADRVGRLGGALNNLGVKPNDRVAMLSLNSDRFIEFCLGTFWAGAVASPLNVRWTVAETRYGLQNGGVKILIVDDSFASMGEALQSDCGLNAVIHAGDAETPSGMLSYEDLLERSESVEDAHRCGDDLAFLLYTGGTTGFPKGVMLSHNNLASASLGMTAMGCATGDSYLHAVPLFHMAGIQMLFNHLIGGGTHVVLPAFQPGTALQLIARERTQSTMLVPTMLQMMVEHPDAQKLDLSSLELVFYGAAPISEPLLRRAMEALPKAQFIQGYGMTETGITLMLPSKYHTPEGQKLGKLRSAGIASPNAEIKIVNDRDQELPRGTPGEILARGPMIMRGYWNQSEQTAEALRSGWMHTGDVGVMDNEGFVFIVDRLKDMIVSGGENIFSTEVENALAQHPTVASCAVIGVPDGKWGERVHAIIVRMPRTMPSEEDLIAHCKQLIAGYKCPRSVEFRDVLPLSAAGKLLKNELRAPYWEGRERSVG